MLKNLLKQLFIFFLFISCFILTTTIVDAQKGHMKLLAVSEAPNMTGSIADLYLEIREGEGRTYIDTYPLTKIDAQLSTRFAKDVACDFLEIDCSDKDFFYQIQAGSLIIGGPSAGASLTVLTISLLDGIPINEKVTMTGTINSGGVIGSVGGLKEKIEIASHYGISKVLIPKGKRNFTEDNMTIDLVMFGKQHGIEVTEVLTLEEAMYQFTGKKYIQPLQNVTVEQGYAATMKLLAEDLCNRSVALKLKLPPTVNISRYQDAKNLTERSKETFAAENYYSSASFCFGANIILDRILLDEANMSPEEKIAKVQSLLSSIKKSQDLTDTIELKTIQDLQTYIIVKERLDEAEEVLTSLNVSLNGNLNSNNTNQSNDYPLINIIQSLAYATERLYSAYSWSNFFGKEGKQFSINDEATKLSCQNKLAEDQVQLQYVKLLYPFDISGIEKGIAEASEEMNHQNYKRCFFKASKAKAEMNALLSSLGITPEQIPDLVQVKIDLFSIIINKQMEKNIFPILGYSYYEYAKSLLATDPGASLLYMEYALELSNIDSYLEIKTKPKIKLIAQHYFDKRSVLVLIIGAIIGFIVGYSRKH